MLNCQHNSIASQTIAMLDSLPWNDTGHDYTCCILDSAEWQKILPAEEFFGIIPIDSLPSYNKINKDIAWQREVIEEEYGIRTYLLFYSRPYKEWKISMLTDVEIPF